MLFEHNSTDDSQSAVGPFMYLFQDTANLSVKRYLLEDILEFPIIELEAHLPHEKHGVVKYDAGGIILALDLAAPRERLLTFGLIALLRVRDPGRVVQRLRSQGYSTSVGEGGVFFFRDIDGYPFEIDARPSPESNPSIAQVRLEVSNHDASVDFYREKLQLPVIAESEGASALEVRGGGRVILHKTANGSAFDKRGYSLVFYTPDIAATHAALLGRGVTFRSRLGQSEIGWTCRLCDPDGHMLCLYEPSQEALTWDSGPKVLELVHGWRP